MTKNKIDIPALIVTREMLIAGRPCYTDAPGKLERHVPSEGIAPLEVCDADIPAKEKLRLLLHRYGDEQPLTDRQYRLLACRWARGACARAGWDDARSLHAIDVAERFAEGNASRKELDEAYRRAKEAAWESREATAWAATWAAWATALEADLWATDGVTWATDGVTWAADLWAAQAEAKDRIKEQQLADIKAVLTGDLFAEGKS